MNSHNYIYLNDLDRLKKLINRINNNEINIFDLSIIDMMKLFDYFKTQSDLVDKELIKEKMIFNLLNREIDDN